MERCSVCTYCFEFSFLWSSSLGFSSNSYLKDFGGLVLCCWNTCNPHLELLFFLLACCRFCDVKLENCWSFILVSYNDVSADPPDKDKASYLISLENSFSGWNLLLSFQKRTARKASRIKTRSREPTMVPMITPARFGAGTTQRTKNKGFEQS